MALRAGLVRFWGHKEAWRESRSRGDDFSLSDLNVRLPVEGRIEELGEMHDRVLGER